MKAVLMSVKPKWCELIASGSVYDKDKSCEHLVYADLKGMTIGKKELKLYCVYCTAEGRCRLLGGIASFTGNSPTWCPKRRGNGEENSEE